MGGGREPGGCPSASRNLRIRSSSVSAGARGTGAVVRGVDVDPRADSSFFLAALFAALVNQRNSIATSTNKKKIGVSKCIFSRQTVASNHVASRGLSDPAIDSRIDVSACTFFIR